jgi:hypothetical protein
MNPFFAALAAVAFGLTVVGADVSAAPQPSRPAPARKVAPVAKAAAKSVPKAAPKAVAKAGAPRTGAVARPAKAPVVKSVVAKGGSAKSTPAKPLPAKAVAGKTPAGKQVATGKAVRGVKAAPGAAPQVPVAKGRAARPVPTVAVAREPRGVRRGRVEPAALEPTPAPVVARQPVVRGGAAPIGREAFVPSSPPIPRAEAVRQLQGRVAAPATAPAVAAAPCITDPSSACGRGFPRCSPSGAQWPRCLLRRPARRPGPLLAIPRHRPNCPAPRPRLPQRQP